MSEAEKKQKKEVDEKTKEKQRMILMIGLFFFIAVIFAISGIANILYGSKAAGADKLLGAAAMVGLGIYYIIRDRKKE